MGRYKGARKQRRNEVLDLMIAENTYALNQATQNITSSMKHDQSLGYIGDPFKQTAHPSSNRNDRGTLGKEKYRDLPLTSSWNYDEERRTKNISHEKGRQEGFVSGSRKSETMAQASVTKGNSSSYNVDNRYLPTREKTMGISEKRDELYSVRRRSPFQNNRPSDSYKERASGELNSFVRSKSPFRHESRQFQRDTRERSPFSRERSQYHREIHESSRETMAEASVRKSNSSSSNMDNKYLPIREKTMGISEKIPFQNDRPSNSYRERASGELNSFVRSKSPFRHESRQFNRDIRERSPFSRERSKFHREIRESRPFSGERTQLHEETRRSPFTSKKYEFDCITQSISSFNQQKRSPIREDSFLERNRNLSVENGREQRYRDYYQTHEAELYQSEPRYPRENTSASGEKCSNSYKSKPYINSKTSNRKSDIGDEFSPDSSEKRVDIPLTTFIVPVAYPNKYFNQFETRHLRQIIKRHLKNSGIIELEIVEGFFRGGVLGIVTKNLYTKSWLEDLVKRLTDQKGQKIRVAHPREIPKPTEIDAVVYVPKEISAKVPRSVLTQLSKQNPGLLTRHWRIKDKHLQSNGEWYIELSLNEEDVIVLEKYNMKPKLGDGQAVINIMCK